MTLCHYLLGSFLILIALFMLVADMYYWKAGKIDYASFVPPLVMGIGVLIKPLFGF